MERLETNLEKELSNNREFFGSFERGDIFKQEEEGKVEVFIFLESHFEEDEMQGWINVVECFQGKLTWSFIGMKASSFLYKI